MIADIFIWLLIDTLLGFILYLTGCVTLKVFTLGLYQIKFKDFASFRANRYKKVNLIMLLGFIVYVLIALLIMKTLPQTQPIF